LAATIDLLPTLARWAGAELPALSIDGRDIRPLVLGTPGAKSPHEAYLIYAGDELQAVRSGRWKLHLKHAYLSVDGPPGRDGKPARHGQMAPLAMSNSGLAGIASRHGYTIREQPLALFDLAADVGETRNVAAQHLDVVARLQTVVERARRALGDSLSGVKGSEVRPSGSVAARSPE
jgi:arylsulfatase A-like enzyme